MMALTGGAGSDIFRFRVGDGSDVVLDFSQGEDKISVVQPGVGSIAFADLTISADGTNTTIGFNDELLVILNSVTGLGSRDFI